MDITAKNFDEQVLKAKTLVILDFWATWCGPCQMQKPVFEEVAKEHPEVLLGKINVDEESDLAEQFDIMSIPTIVCMKDGKIVKRLVGYQEKSELESYIEELK